MCKRLRGPTEVIKPNYLNQVHHYTIRCPDKMPHHKMPTDKVTQNEIENIDNTYMRILAMVRLRRGFGLKHSYRHLVRDFLAKHRF